MIDIKDMIQNLDRYTHELKIRNMDENLAIDLAALYSQKNDLQQKIDECRNEKNLFNKSILDLDPDQKKEAIFKMKKIDEIQNQYEAELESVKVLYQSKLYAIPNLSWPYIPIGNGEEDNVATGVFGQKIDFAFTPKEYFQLPGFIRDYNSTAGVKAVGTRGYYITGSLARLQRVLFNWVAKKLDLAGFEYVIPPVMVNENVMYGTGFFPNSKNDFYTVNPNEDNLFLVGSSEPSLMFLHAGETLELSKPKLLTAQTDCFRREAGSHGKDTRGGIRVHQFPKIEMVALTKPENSEEVFDYLTSLFSEFMTELGLHYRYLEVCSGDQSMKNYRMIDIEAWFPAHKEFREVCSSSNCTDYQTRNLGIKTKIESGDTVLAHSLNCTAVTNRTLFAILEQFQNQDGSVNVPTPLQEQFGSSKYL
jgi:seryl-tRNA synthetase